MSYRLSTPVKPLIWVEASVESHKGSRVEYMVKCKAQFKRRSSANNVEIYVPVPDDADSPKFRVGSPDWFACIEADEVRYLGVYGQRAVRPRQVCIRMEDQATWRRPGIPDACSLWSSKRKKRSVCLTQRCAID